MAEPINPEAAAAVIQQVTQPAATPIRIETQTGQVFEGATNEEVLQQLVRSVESGTSHIRQQREQLEALQQQVQSVQQTQQSPTNGQKSFQDQYWELWQKDPIAADRYAASVRLGVPIEQVDHIERQTIQNSFQSAQDKGISDFLDRCPDFPKDDPEAAQALKYALQTQAPQYQSLPAADRMELAFNALVRQGAVQPLDVPIEGYEEQQAPLPRVGSGSNLPPQDFERQFRGLTSTQQAQVINELFAKGAR